MLDGLDERLCRDFDWRLPSLLGAKGRVFPLQEDLWSRGWVEYFTGLHGTETGAFYDRPVANGTLQFSQGFGTQHYEAMKLPTLWRQLNRLGLSVGAMGLPTTMPAPEVDGFFVAGAGGGVSGTGEVPPEACWPRSVHAWLQEQGVRGEIRYHHSGTERPLEFLRLERDVLAERQQAFSGLADQHRVDAGLFFDKSVVHVTNLFRAELDRLARGEQTRNGEALHQHLEALDRSYCDLVERLQPEHLIVVSDHGSCVHRYNVNLNALLNRSGLLHLQASRVLLNRIKRLVPTGVKGRLKSLLRRSGRARGGGGSGRRLVLGGTLDPSRSLAFGSRYVPGVYLLDERFGAEAIPPDRREALVSHISAQINADPELSAIGVRAEAAAKAANPPRARRLLPEVRIEAPEGVFFVEEGPLVAAQDVSREVPEVLSQSGSLYSGVKGRAAYFGMSDPIASDQAETSPEAPADLRLAHELTLALARRIAGDTGSDA